MALYKLTYMNTGKKTSLREVNFDSDLDAKNFAKFYNSTNESGRVIKITKVVAEMSAKEKSRFVNQTYNIGESLDTKVMYRTTKRLLFNMMIPYLDKTYKESELDTLMGHVNDFLKREDETYSATKYF